MERIGRDADKAFCHRKALIFLAGLVGVGILAGCQTAFAPPGTTGAAVQLGDNTIGESCRLVGDVRAGPAPTVDAAFALYCGQWEEPSAHIVVAPGEGVGAQGLISGSVWRSRLDAYAVCSKATPTTILDGVSALSLDCTLRTGGWSYQAVAAEVGGKTYLADAIPAAYPAAERAIGLLSGKLTSGQAGDTGAISGEIRRLEARLSDARYSAGDLSAYQDLLRLGQYYNYQGDHALSEQAYRRALGVQEKVLAGQSDALAHLHMHIGLALSNQERFAPAESMFALAKTHARSAIDPAHAPRLVSYRALHMANQRRDEEALRLARQATAMRREIARNYGHGLAPVTPSASDVSNSGALVRGEARQSLLDGYGATAFGDLVQSDYLESVMLLQMGRIQEAKAPLNEAMQVLQQEPRVSRRWLVVVQMQQALIAEKEGNHGRAAGLLASAIETQRSLFTESRTEGMALIALGRAHAAQGRYDAALKAFRDGVKITGKHGGGVRLEELLPFFRVGLAEAGRNPGRRDAIFAELFEAGQLVRGPVVSQSMALMSARLAAGDQTAGGVIRNLQDARRQRDEARQRLTLVQSDARFLGPQVAEVEKKWGAINREVADLERQVQAAAPRYNQLLDAPVSAEDVRGVLDSGEAIGQILVGTDGSFGFFADSAGITAYQIELTAREVQQIVSELRHPFEAQDTIPPFPVDRSYELFQALFAPVAERLQGKQHLVAVPSGDLLSLPLGLLVVERPPPVSGYDYSRVPWMASRHALTLAPSVQSFVNLRKTVQPSRAGSVFVGFGDFVPSGDPSGLMSALGMPASCRGQAEAVAYARRLPETAQELQSVGRVLGDSSNLILGSRFSEPTLRGTPLDRYRIVSFATHGLLPSKLQCLPEPALLVSKSSPGDASGDGLLTSSEVLEIKMDADLVVLSACDTGGPEGATGGEALSGLARAFFYAGARTMMVTHWEIPSGFSAQLISDTFRRAASGDVTVAEALRDAQKAMISEPVSHPKAWAGFTLVGDGGQRLTRTRVATAASP